jgi:lipid II:glycine glycyltransferase (peptidoglycan interpeptide bridge formation enzyme)
MEIREIQSKTKWENFLESCQEKTFLHSFNWGEFQKRMGLKVWRLGIYGDDKLLATAQVLKIKAKRGTFLFVPHGPIIIQSQISNLKSQNDPEAERSVRYGASNSKFKIKILRALLDKLKALAEEEKASFIRIAPIWERNDENKKIFKNLGFGQAPIHIHPEVTWELDITPPEEKILMAMRKTTRYLIRRGLKNKDLKVSQSQNIKDLEIFNQIYQETAKHHKFIPFSFEYLKKEFEAFLPDNQVSLFLARYKKETIAGAVIVFWQGRAFYHHGASLKKYPKIPASYLIQWEAICQAKKRDCKLYNFWGIADISSKSSRSSRHPWAGLSLFKQGFGGYKKEYLRTQDYILSNKYWLNYLVEKLRKKKRGF